MQKKFLSDIVKHHQVSEIQKTKIRKIIGLIDIGKYTNLPTDIDRLRKKKLHLNDSLAEIDKIAKRYDIDESVIHKDRKETAEKPMLIISESFE
ncbi:MAG: hypothetical protein KatS3mg027_2437 [Bacteroidia bacterium]|nr:MAG: hypothetical protein KatS3mg027_2437 [Bacteroidia bacterium]